jgi:epsin
LIQDDERLRTERANRSNMQSRLGGGGRRANTFDTPTDTRHPQRRRQSHREDDDEEMRRAIEASKLQADEDAKRRRAASGETDEDMAKAIKASKEEEELRQSRLSDQNANSLFDDSWDQPAQQAPQPVYQQQQQVDLWGNPIDMNAQQQQQQSTGYLQDVYSQPTGFLAQPAGYGQPQMATNGFNNDFSTNNPYMQTGAQQQPQQFSQLTGFQPSQQSQAALSNNPYTAQQPPEPLQPLPTGSNNPFAQFGPSFNQQTTRTSFSPSLSTLSEQQQQQQLPQHPFSAPGSFSVPSLQPAPKQQPQPTTHQQKLDYLLAQGNPTGQDTFGNTGETRVPAHFQRTGFVNSSGQGLRPSMTGFPAGAQPQNNPFYAGQSGGPRPLTQSTTGPAYAQSSQFGQYGQQGQQGQTGSLIDF